MKTILRIFAILAVALIVVGVAVALSGSGASSGLGQRGFERQGAPGGFGGPRLDGDFGGSPDSALTMFALTTVFKNAVLVGWIGLMVVLALHGARALRTRLQRRRQAQAGSTPGA
jgi:hypothetical protein